MSIQLGPDWRKLAEAQKVELSDRQRERLESLGRTMAGLRGLIDWTEEPLTVFDCGHADSVSGQGEGEAGQ